MNTSMNSKKYFTNKLVVFLLFFEVLITLNMVLQNSNEEGAEMGKLNTPIIVEFPLRGEWLSPNTPGTKIPSHGTNKLGTTYAYDFIQVDWNRAGLPAYCVSFPEYLLFGAPLNKYYCWGQEIYAPCDGTVVVAQDGCEERTRTNLFYDLSNTYKNAHYFDPTTDDVQSVAGNYIVIGYSENIFAVLCHLQTGSLQVSVGQKVKAGDFIGQVGHSGNSFAPHLHFQLMDSWDITVANGLLCAFEKYEVYENGEWKTVENGIPTNQERIRFQE